MTDLPTERESLQVLLGKVHERLNEGGVDASSRAMLTQLMADIEKALGRADVAAAPSAVQAPPLAEESNTSRLEALAVRFEAGHPDLAASLRRLVDLLSEVGI